MPRCTGKQWVKCSQTVLVKGNKALGRRRREATLLGSSQLFHCLHRLPLFLLPISSPGTQPNPLENYAAVSCGEIFTSPSLPPASNGDPLAIPKKQNPGKFITVYTVTKPGGVSSQRLFLVQLLHKPLMSLREGWAAGRWKG